jgi:Aspartyl protease
MLALLLPISVLAGSQSQDSGGDLDILLVNKQYPELELAFQRQGAALIPEARTYFEGVIANRLSQAPRSLALLEPLAPQLLVNNPKRGEIALCAVADDYAKEFRYRDAAKVYTEAERIAKQQNLVSSCNAATQALRWSLFRDAPAQTASSPGNFTVQGRCDTIGLIQIPVSAGAYSGTWILDTGANLSLISQSVAAQIGVDVSGEAATAEAGAGVAISVHAAVVPQLQVGAATLHNLPVLVAPDSDLDFPSINYRIEGSLGFPVLAALQNFTVYRDGRVRLGGASETSTDPTVPHNLFLEKFTPVISADLGLGNRLFTIDTGAIGTVLSSAFYRESKPLNSGEPIQLELVGAGGTLVSAAYQMKGVGARLGGSCAEIERVQMLTKPIGSAEEFYGNIGENAFTSFNSFTLDFAAMHFSVDASPRSCDVEP